MNYGFTKLAFTSSNVRTGRGASSVRRNGIAGCRPTSSDLIQAHDAFEDKLAGELKKELDEVFSKDSAVNSLYNVQYFADGFKLGARLMLEILAKDK